MSGLRIAAVMGLVIGGAATVLAAKVPSPPSSTPLPATSLPAKPDLSRYQVIADRQPFGRPQEVVAPVGPPVPTGPVEPSFIKFLKMVALLDDSDGVRAGFVRLGPAAPPRPGTPPGEAPQANDFFYLRVGGESTSDGITLVEVNKETESAVLLKGADRQTISIPASGQGGGNAASAQAGRAPIGSPGAMAPAANASAAAAAAGSYQERLKQRREARERRNAELMAATTNPARPSAEELEKHLRNYNLNLIRQKGEQGPPLPIALTPEEDDQLVKEGVLPPR